MPDYRICIINPPGYKHSYCFLELALLLRSSIADLGISCDIKINDLSTGRINIILGGHLIQNVSALKNFSYIPYQLEQLGAAQSVYTPGFEEYLSNAQIVWDYSPENITFLKGKNIKAAHIPIGYHKVLEQIPHYEPRKYDVLFYGSLGPRRSAILEELSSRGVTIKHLFGVYGQQRDKEIASSEIIINIHHYDTKIFEAVRISYLLNNRCFIVSEESLINPYDKLDLCLVPYGKLAETCLYYLNNKAAREELRLKWYRQFRENYDMRGILEREVR